MVPLEIWLAGGSGLRLARVERDVHPMNRLPILLDMAHVLHIEAET
jgi:hypothetical protein